MVHSNRKRHPFTNPLNGGSAIYLLIGTSSLTSSKCKHSLKPEKGGLFCERIFGPIQDYECACGKKPQLNQKFCSVCEVEYTSSRVRRYRLGYIQLIIPITHIWYLKGRPSYLAILLNLSKQKTESIIYCTQWIVKIFGYLNFGTHLKNQLFAYKPHLYRRNISAILKKRKRHFTTQIRIFIQLKLPTTPKHRFGRNVDNKRYSTSQSELHKKIKIQSQTCALHFFCIDQKFCFLESHHYFYFSIYSRNFRFQKDEFNSFYKTRSTIPNHYPPNLNQSGTIPIVEFLFILDPQNLANQPLLQLERQIRIILLNWKKKFFYFSHFNKPKFMQRLKMVRAFRQNKTNPSWMTLFNLPVLPPDLRPILQLTNEQIAVSDLNKLYQKVLFRNRRLANLLTDNYGHNIEEIQYAQRLLQESVDALIENGKNGTIPHEVHEKRALKSLSDMLKGKKGRFRQNLLGKRVDYSGRSVIVVGPHLKLHECGLPIEMAIELFQPFLLRQIVNRQKSKTILGAKKLISNHTREVLPLLREIMTNYPILLNRAPTLHRLSIQAFQPVLVTGRAILLHPLVCSAFNADFDGDQMAVHIPLSFEARSEAWKLLWSINNFISSSTGQPILIPSQDMILGCYFLTYQNMKFTHDSQLFLRNSTHRQVPIAPVVNMNSIHSFIFNNYQPTFCQLVWLNLNSKFETDQKYQLLLELQLDQKGKIQKIYPNKQQSFSSGHHLNYQYILTTLGRVLFYTLFSENS